MLRVGQRASRAYSKWTGRTRDLSWFQRLSGGYTIPGLASKKEVIAFNRDLQDSGHRVWIVGMQRPVS